MVFDKTNFFIGVFRKWFLYYNFLAHGVKNVNKLASIE